MITFSVHAHQRMVKRFGVELSKRRMKTIRDSIYERRYKLLRYDNVRNRVLELPHLGMELVYSDISRKVVTVWPSKDEHEIVR